MPAKRVNALAEQVCCAKVKAQQFVPERSTAPMRLQLSAPGNKSQNGSVEKEAPCGQSRTRVDGQRSMQQTLSKAQDLSSPMWSCYLEIVGGNNCKGCPLVECCQVLWRICSCHGEEEKFCEQWSSGSFDDTTLKKLLENNELCNAMCFLWYVDDVIAVSRALCESCLTDIVDNLYIVELSGPHRGVDSMWFDFRIKFDDWSIEFKNENGCLHTSAQEWANGRAARRAARRVFPLQQFT